MKIGFASGHLKGTGAEVKQQQQPKELVIMNDAVEIRKGKPVYATIRRSLWELVRIA